MWYPLSRQQHVRSVAEATPHGISSEASLASVSILGRLDVAAGEKDEQLVAGVDDDGVSQMATISVGRLELKQAVERTLEFACVRLDGDIGEIGPAATDIAGVLQVLVRRGRTRHHRHR